MQVRRVKDEARPQKRQGAVSEPVGKARRGEKEAVSWLPDDLT